MRTQRHRHGSRCNGNAGSWLRQVGRHLQKPGPGQAREQQLLLRPSWLEGGQAGPPPSPLLTHPSHSGLYLLPLSMGPSEVVLQVQEENRAPS